MNEQNVRMQRVARIYPDRVLIYIKDIEGLTHTIASIRGRAEVNLEHLEDTNTIWRIELFNEVNGLRIGTMFADYIQNSGYYK